ncbi:MAG: hypothetical protein ABJA67_16475, partial [Chthonomonadales bacterium]
ISGQRPTTECLIYIDKFRAANIDPVMIKLDVVEHARNRIEIIEARLKAERETNVLLRPATMDDLGLLRPATSPGNEDAGRILRPASSDDIALLRPASADGDILLQPATGPGFEDPNSLLRPAEPIPSDSEFKH